MDLRILSLERHKSYIDFNNFLVHDYLGRVLDLEPVYCGGCGSQEGTDCDCWC